MFPLLVKLEKMDLQMEYISDKYNIYTNYQKNNWNPLKGLTMIFAGQENPCIIFRSKEVYIYFKTNIKIPINLLK